MDPLSPQIIIRPSGVWNSRAPYHNYLVETSSIDRDYCLLTLAVSRTRHDADHITATSSTNTVTFMRTKISGRVARKVWNRYRDFWRLKTDKPDGQPGISDLEQDLGLSLYAIREFAVIRWSSIFETFSQCWALNMLLARLERSETLTPKEERLVRQLSPIYTRRPRGVPSILDCFQDVREELDGLPHINSDPYTKMPVAAPIHPELTALRSILFWRDYRNLLVHRGGRISMDFIETHGAFFEAFRQNYSEVMRELRPTGRLQLPSMIVPAISTTHTKAAKWLNEVLVRASCGTRGKLRPPSEEEPVKLDLNLIPPKLLTDGDHSTSLKWVLDASLLQRREVNKT